MEPEDSTQPKNQPALRLPSPRWLPVAATLLAVWALALGLWWRQLSAPAPATLPTPVAGPTRVAAVTPSTGTTPTPAPEGTPVTQPVVRQPGLWIRQQQWLALARALDEQHALTAIAELSSARYAGRATGSPGGRLAAEWIAERMAEYGLQPAGDHGTYFQEFPVPYGELTAMPSLQIVDDTGQPRHEYALRRDYAPVLGGYADGGQAEGPVLWLSDGKRADYAGIDAAGAVVLCRAPAQPNDALRQALEHGARAVLLLRSDPTHFDMRRLVREEALLPQGIPALYVSPRVAQDLLEGSGLTLDDLTIQYTARPLATRVHLTLPLQYQSGATGRNVLGVLPGSDPEAGRQVLIVSGHYDHVGADPDGTVWGGANDNASGVAIVLEIARQWKEQGFVPQRSVLFAA